MKMTEPTGEQSGLLWFVFAQTLLYVLLLNFWLRYFFENRYIGNNKQ